MGTDAASDICLSASVSNRNTCVSHTQCHLPADSRVVGTRCIFRLPSRVAFLGEHCLELGLRFFAQRGDEEQTLIFRYFSCAFVTTHRSFKQFAEFAGFLRSRVVFKDSHQIGHRNCGIHHHSLSRLFLLTCRRHGKQLLHTEKHKCVATSPYKNFEQKNAHTQNFIHIHTRVCARTRAR